MDLSTRRKNTRTECTGSTYVHTRKVLVCARRKTSLHRRMNCVYNFPRFFFRSRANRSFCFVATHYKDLRRTTILPEWRGVCTPYAHTYLLERVTRIAPTSEWITNRTMLFDHVVICINHVSRSLNRNIVASNRERTNIRKLRGDACFSIRCIRYAAYNKHETRQRVLGWKLFLSPRAYLYPCEISNCTSHFTVDWILSCIYIDLNLLSPTIIYHT